MKEKILVSACLLGENCKYNGGNNRCEEVLTFVKDKEVIAICPEVMGGLSTPRIPCEIIGDKVINKEGEDKTFEYEKGAQIALDLALQNDVKKAILKAKSPSCGVDKIYDGTFSSTLVDGDGVCVRLLKKHGILVYSENDIKEEMKK